MFEQERTTGGKAISHIIQMGYEWNNAKNGVMARTFEAFWFDALLFGQNLPK